MITGSTTEATAVRTLAPRRGLSSFGLREARSRLDLLLMLIARELKLRYTQTVLGPLWVILNPLVPALLFTLVFTRVVRIQTTEVSYLLLVTTAMAPWTLFSRSVTRGGGSLIAERHLLTKVYFPRLLIPVAVVAASVFDLLVSIAIAMCTYPGSGAAPTTRLAVLPVLIVWALLLSLSVTVMFAGLSVRRRDLVVALPFLLQILLYLSPVAYPLASVNGAVRHLIRFNPMTALVQGFQWSITGRTELPLVDLVIGVTLTALCLAAGLAVFAVAQRDVADVL